MDDKITSCAGDLINLAYNTSSEETNRQLACVHRTQQQIFAGLIFSWLNYYATECRVDDRIGRAWRSARNCSESIRTQPARTNSRPDSLWYNH